MVTPDEAKITIRCERIEPGVPNLNGRTYSREIFEKMIEQAQARIRNGLFLGQLGQSSMDGKMRLRNASHRVLDLRIDEDGKLAADCEILLDTEKGRELADMIEVGGLDSIEIVPRGIGSLTDGVVGEDYRLAGLDVMLRLREE